MSGNEVTIDWQDAEIVARIQRAEARALVAFGYKVSQFAKTIVHVLTGTLRRSIHLAQDNYADGAGDLASAKSGTDLGATQAAMLELVHFDGPFAVLAVGSWIVYANIQEARYPYMWPAYQQLAPSFLPTLVEAMRQEGFA